MAHLLLLISDIFLSIFLSVVLCFIFFSAFSAQSFCSLNFLFLQNKDVTEAIQKVAAAYDCKIVEGVLSHQLKQFVIDGNKVILSVSNPDTRVDDAEFEENEVYAVDIFTSTGEGKVILKRPYFIVANFVLLYAQIYVVLILQPKLLDEKTTTIYKRAVDKNYHLKMKSSRFIFSEINQKFPIMPFSARFVFPTLLLSCFVVLFPLFH